MGQKDRRDGIYAVRPTGRDWQTAFAPRPYETGILLHKLNKGFDAFALLLIVKGAAPRRIILTSAVLPVYSGHS